MVPGMGFFSSRWSSSVNSGEVFEYVISVERATYAIHSNIICKGSLTGLIPGEAGKELDSRSYHYYLVGSPEVSKW